MSLVVASIPYLISYIVMVLVWQEESRCIMCFAACGTMSEEEKSGDCPT
jgi:hypothetical protein